MTGEEGKDLSAGSISRNQRIDFKGDLAEESERRWWKTRLLWATAFLILFFYGALIGFVFTIPKRIEHTHVLIAAILAAIPTLLSINFLKLVRSKDSSDSDGIESNPWFSLLKEFVEALKK